MNAQAMATRYLPPEAFGLNDGVLREFIDYSLWSSFALNAGAPLPRIMELFTYLPGQQVAGAGAGALANATKWHTNLEAIRTVGKPQTFTFFQIRFTVMPLVYTGSVSVADVDNGLALAATNQVEDLAKIVESCSFRFSIGEKRYAEGQLKDLPSQTGIDGVAAVSLGDTAVASAFQNRIALYTAGRVYRFGPDSKRPVLYNSEPFKFELYCDWATNPTITQNKIVVVNFDGVLGRAVQ